MSLRKSPQLRPFETIEGPKIIEQCGNVIENKGLVSDNRVKSGDIIENSHEQLQLFDSGHYNPKTERFEALARYRKQRASH